MQQLQMSMHNQMMVKDMLRDIHLGDEEEEAAGDECDGNDDSADLRWMPIGDVEKYVLLYSFWHEVKSLFLYLLNIRVLLQ